MDVPKWVNTIHSAWVAIGAVLIGISNNLPDWVVAIFGATGSQLLFAALGAVVIFYQYVRNEIAKGSVSTLSTPGTGDAILYAIWPFKKAA